MLGKGHTLQAALMTFKASQQLPGDDVPQPGCLITRRRHLHTKTSLALTTSHRKAAERSNWAAEELTRLFAPGTQATSNTALSCASHSEEEKQHHLGHDNDEVPSARHGRFLLLISRHFLWFNAREDVGATTFFTSTSEYTCWTWGSDECPDFMRRNSKFYPILTRMCVLAYKLGQKTRFWSRLTHLSVQCCVSQCYKGSRSLLHSLQPVCCPAQELQDTKQDTQTPLKCIKKSDFRLKSDIFYHI